MAVAQRLTRWLLVASIELALATPGAAVAAGFGDIAVVRAMDALRSGEDARALGILDEVLTPARRGEVWTEARFIGARAALSGGQPDRALELLGGLESDLPELADFIIAYRARALRQAGQWLAGLEAWGALVRQFPTSPMATEALFGIADAQYALGQLTRAKASYLIARSRAPHAPWAGAARFTIASIDEALGRYSDAAGTYRFLAYHRPTDPLADLAMQRFEALVAAGHVKPASFRTRLSRLDRLLNRRLLTRASSALADLEAVTSSPSRVMSLRFRRAQLEYRKRNFQDAIATFEELAGASSGNRRSEYRRWLARCYAAAGENGKAVEIYRDLAGAYGTRARGREALFHAAWLAYDGHQYDHAVELFSEFLERHPHDSATDEALWYLAWNAYRLGDLNTARATLEQVERDFSRSSLVQRSRYWRGRVLAQLGRPGEARAAYEAALAAGPLSYYGVLARQRLTELDAPEMKIARKDGVMVASTDIESLRDLGRSDRGPEAMQDDLPEANGLRRSTAGGLPWGDNVLNWSGRNGERAIRLIKVGLPEHAATIIKQLDPLPGHDPETVAYARARILYSLGDFHGAYLIGMAAFRDEIAGEPSRGVRRYFRLAFPDAHVAEVRHATDEFGVSPLILWAVMRQESAFRTTARSWAAAQGLMQIIPPTGAKIAEALGDADFAIGKLNDPAVSVRYGAWYLGQLLESFRGNLPLALGSYNAGPQAVSRWVDAADGLATDEFIEEIPYRETRHYVKQVLANLAVYSALYGGTMLTVRQTVPTAYRETVDF